MVSCCTPTVRDTNGPELMFSSFWCCFCSVFEPELKQKKTRSGKFQLLKIYCCVMTKRKVDSVVNREPNDYKKLRLTDLDKENAYTDVNDDVSDGTDVTSSGADSDDGDSKISKMDMNQFREDFIHDTEAESIKDATAANSKPESENIVAFDVKDEMENGYFDKDGNYIERENNSSQSEDEFYNNLTSKDIEANLTKKLNSLEKLKLRKRKIQSEKRQLLTADVLLRLYYLIPNGMTVLETLANYNKLRSKEKNEFKYLISNAIDYLTELTDLLQQKNFDSIDNIFSWTRQDILEYLGDESLESNFKIDNYGARIWSFKWFKNLNKCQTPYSNYEMQYWKDTYFDGKVACKLTDDDDVDKNWLHITCIQFM